MEESMELSYDRLRNECIPVGSKTPVCDCMRLHCLKRLPKSDGVQYTEDYNVVSSSGDGRWLFRAVAIHACQKVAHLLYSQEVMFGFSILFQTDSFLSAFAELRKATVSFVKSVRME